MMGGTLARCANEWRVQVQVLARIDVNELGGPAIGARERRGPPEVESEWGAPG